MSKYSSEKPTVRSVSKNGHRLFLTNEALIAETLNATNTAPGEPSYEELREMFNGLLALAKAEKEIHRQEIDTERAKNAKLLTMIKAQAEPWPGQAPGEVDLTAWSSTDGLEDVEWTKTYQVEGLIEKGRIYEFFGQWKEGKTLALLDMLAHTSLGMDWAGRRTTPSLVLYVASEAPEDVKRRLAAWRIRNGIHGPMPFLIREKPVHLDNAQFAGQLAAEVAEIRKRYPELSILLAIDTVARSLSPGAEENGAGLSAFINNLIDLVARPTDATAIVVHHSGHGDKDRGRGWSGMPAALDGDFKVSKSADDPPIFTVECKFLRNGGKTGTMAFRLETVELLGQDNFENKIIEPVLRYLADHQPADKPQNQERPYKPSGDDELTLKVLRRLHRQHEKNLRQQGYDGPARVTEEQWRHEFYSTPEVKGRTQYAKSKAFSRAVERLTGGGLANIKNGFASIEEPDKRTAHDRDI